MTINDMWDRLTAHQPYADARGSGPEWVRMCEERTPEAAWVAADVSSRWSATGATAAVKWIEKAEGKNND